MSLMRIAVTGGSGKLGRTVVRVLREEGHDVLNLDRTGERGSGFVQVDLTDYGQTIDALMGVDEHSAGFDAVVHLAAVPAPGGLLPDVATFHNNMTATYNVLRAAIRAGVRTIVTASSETVLGGLPFDTPPPYIPVDEDCTSPESNYSLSKHLEEQLAIQLVRWHPDVSIQALRFSNVMDPEDYAAFASFDSDPRLRKWNLWGGYVDARMVHRRCSRRSSAGGASPASSGTSWRPPTPSCRAPPTRSSWRRCSPPASRSAATSGSTTRSCPSRRHAACWDTNRLTPGVRENDAGRRRDAVTRSAAP